MVSAIGGDSWDRTKMDHGPEATLKVIEYLANYVGRVALSDSRILDIDGDRVLFKYKDYRDNNQQKAEWIEGVKLIHRFSAAPSPATISSHSPLRLDGPSCEAGKTRLHPAVPRAGARSPLSPGSKTKSLMKQHAKKKSDADLPLLCRRHALDRPHGPTTSE